MQTGSPACAALWRKPKMGLQQESWLNRMRIITGERHVCNGEEARVPGLDLDQLQFGQYNIHPAPRNLRKRYDMSDHLPLTTPATPQELFALLDKLAIPHSTTQHEAVFTVEEVPHIKEHDTGWPHEEPVREGQRRTIIS
ncbi:MAG: hypothetical protein R3D34_02305 [Nitratireductor sp.]